MRRNRRISPGGAAELHPKESWPQFVQHLGQIDQRLRPLGNPQTKADWLKAEVMRRIIVEAADGILEISIDTAEDLAEFADAAPPGRGSCVFRDVRLADVNV